MKILPLAWRNLLRNRRRSAMTLTAMALGQVAVLLFGGYVKDLIYGLQTEFVQSSGHLQVQHKDYFRVGSGNPAAYGIAGYERIVETVKNDPVLKHMLVVVTPSLQLGGIAGNYESGVSRTVEINGMVIDEQNKMREWNDYEDPVLTRPLALSGTPIDTVVIGTGVARVLQLCAALRVADCAEAATGSAGAGDALPGDIAALADTGAKPQRDRQAQQYPRIEILAANTRGAPNVAAVKVLNAEYQGVKELDDVYVGMHLSQAQRLVYGSAPPQVTAISLQLRHTAQIPAAKERLTELLETTFKDVPLGVLDYEVLNPYYGQALTMFAAMFGFIAVLIGGIVLFTVSNTMSMAVVERTTEIGTLRAIGLKQHDIRSMFLAESAMLGCSGAALGIVTALALAWIINHTGLTWLPPGRIESIPLALRVAGEYTMLISTAVALVLVAVLSGVLPASRAARMNIVEALRHA